MKQTFTVKGMMCDHCRTRVEKALNSVEGVTATVTLDPPQAVVESEHPVSRNRLQQAIARQAGDFTLL